MRITIKRKVFLAVMAAVLGFILAINLATLMLLQDIGRREILISLESGVSAFQRFESQRRELLQNQARSLAATPFLKATLTIPGVDAATAEYAISQFELHEDISNIVVLDSYGEILAAVGEQTLATWKASAVIKRHITNALSGQVVYDSILLDEQFLQLTIVPSTAGEQVVGLIMITQALNSVASMQTLKDITGTSVALVFDDQVIVAAGDKADDFVTALAQDLRTKSQSGVVEQLGSKIMALSVSGMDYFGVRRELGNSGGLILYRSAEMLPDTINQMRWITVLSSLFGIVLGMAFSAWIASKISKPIVAITRVAGDFGSGETGVRVVTTSNDELGELGKTFNEMADQLVSDQAQLVASKEEAEAANRAKSTFLATMSHEIRTPLNGVLGMTEVLSRDTSDAKQKRSLDIIRQSGVNLLAIINDILDFSKLEAEKLELDNQPIKLDEFLINLCQSHLGVCQNKGIVLNQTCVPEQDVTVEVDVPRLSRILNNLIGNAIKFTESGGVNVVAEVVGKHDKYLLIRFAINDTGIGIDPDHIERLFDPFIQADDSYSRQFGGTGLGLAISKQLVELMGGSIQVTSELGRGSCFSFELKLEASAPINEVPVSGNVTAVSEAPANRDISPSTKLPQKHLVLVVEDCPVNQEVAELMLIDMGCEVTLADNGRSGLEATSNQSFDLIFMDCQMPEMDGYEAAKELRRRELREGGRHIPIVALTANAVQGDKESCLAAGMDDYISKPYTEEVLASKLEKWIPAS